MITLANDHLRLTLDPAFGARVTALTDLASGRQWLVPGDCVGGDSYLGEQARGWDECFPTVAACSDPVWGDMRDHGLLWGREWQVGSGPDTCTAVYEEPRFRFSRRLRLDGGTLTAEYLVTNRTEAPLPYLWSQHVLLATTPADRIALQGVQDMSADGHPFDWPGHPLRDLSVIGGIGDVFALKSYGETPLAAHAGITGPAGGIRFSWTGAGTGGVAGVSAFGLWLDYGGWPPGAPVHQVALEPCTAPADDLATVSAMGRARMLGPGASHAWAVRLSMTPASPVRTR